MFTSFKNIDVTPTLLRYLGFVEPSFVRKDRRYKEYDFPNSFGTYKIEWPEWNCYPKKWIVTISDYDGVSLTLKRVSNLFELNNIFLGLFDKHLADNNNFTYNYLDERDKRKDKSFKLNIIDQLYKEGIVKEYLENL